MKLELASPRDCSTFAVGSPTRGALDDLVQQGLCLGAELEGWSELRIVLHLDERPPGRPLSSRSGTVRLDEQIHIVCCFEGELEEASEAVPIAAGTYHVQQFSRPSFAPRKELVEEFGEATVALEERLALSLGCCFASLIFVVPLLAMVALGFVGSGAGAQLIARVLLAVFFGVSTVLALAWRFGLRKVSDRREALNKRGGALVLHLESTETNAPLQGFHLST